MPPELGSTQTALLSFLAGAGGGAGSAMAPRLVVSDGRASAEERLQVYAHMYRARLVEALDAVYPRLVRLLGPDAFRDLALAYVAARPSRHPSLRFLGLALPEWLEEHRPESPWLADLARLEWARSDVFDAADEPVLVLDDLRTLSPEGFARLPLRLIGAHRLLTVDHATAGLWDAMSPDTPADPSFDPSGEPDDSHGETLLVWREDTVVYHRVLDTDECAAIERIARGTTFGAVCEMLAPRLSPETAATRAFAWLSTWIKDRLLAASR